MHRAMNQPSVIISSTCWLLVVTSQEGHILLFMPYNLCFWHCLQFNCPASSSSIGNGKVVFILFSFFQPSFISGSVAVAALMQWQCWLIFSFHKKYLFFRDRTNAAAMHWGGPIGWVGQSSMLFLVTVLICFLIVTLIGKK